MMTGLGFGFVGLLFMLLFWGGLIALAVWLVRAVFTGGTRTPYSPEGRGERGAREILNQRYARGELSKEQFERMKQDLL